jgi:DNA replication protein DnaC
MGLASNAIEPFDAAVRKKWEEHEQRKQEERKLARRSAIWKGVCESRGRRYSSARLENFECQTDAQRDAVKKLSDYCGDIDQRIEAGQNVLLLGPVGGGKDHLAFGVCYAAVKAFHEVLWVNGTTLWLAFRRAISRDYKGTGRNVGLLDDYFQYDSSLCGDEAAIVDQLQQVDVLALSDPAPPGGQLSDYQATTLFEIIDSRYSQCRPTILTLNCATRAEAEQRIGQQVIDRLAHDSLNIVCNWPSYRQKQPEVEA